MNCILKTSRLTLQPFAPADVGLLYRTFTDPHVRKYLWDDRLIDVEQAGDIVMKSHEYFSRSNWGLWKIFDVHGDYVGFAGLWPFFDEQQPQLLYGLMPAHCKKGYACDAARAIVEFAFRELGFDHVIASCDTANTDSVRVCQRIGMSMIEERVMDGKPVVFFKVGRQAIG